MEALIVIYLLLHGAFICYGVMSFLQGGGLNSVIDGMEGHKPFWMKIQPILVLIAFVFGPIGLILYLIVSFFVPSSQKIWLQ